MFWMVGDYGECVYVWWDYETEHPHVPLGYNCGRLPLCHDDNGDEYKQYDLEDEARFAFILKEHIETCKLIRESRQVWRKH